MKSLRVILVALFSTLTLSSFSQSNPPIADQVMRRDTGLVLIKRQQTDKYIVAAAIDKRNQTLYMLDRQGNAWDSLKVQPGDYSLLVSRKTDPFVYYTAKQRLGITYQNELIRQFRQLGRLDSLSPLYASALHNFPEFKHVDSISVIKHILTLERQNRRDSIYAWGGTIGDPRYFLDEMTYTHVEDHKPGERFASGDTLFFINPETLSRIHLAILVKKQSRISYFSRDGKYIAGFTLDPGEMNDVAKTEVFRNYLQVLEQGKIMVDKQVANLSRHVPAIRYANLKESDKILAGALNTQRIINDKIAYAVSPDLKVLATTLRDKYRNLPVNRQWLGFLGIEDYTTPPSWDSVGTRRYELRNHLGNVMVTITDKRIAAGSYYLPDISTAQDYYAFGALMPARTFKADSNYRYGFNGKENDNEVKGIGNQQDYGKRIYDPRVGRFLSVDPLTPKYAELTPYQFASNTPIQAVDLDGLEAAAVYLPRDLTLKQEDEFYHGLNASYRKYGVPPMMVMGALIVGPEEALITMFRTGLAGAAVNGTISIIQRQTASDVTRSIISGFAGGAMLGISPETSIPSLLATGALSGAVGEYTDQYIKNEYGSGGGYSLKDIVKSAGVGAIANSIAGKLVKAVESYVDKKVALEIAKTKTPEYRKLIESAVRQDYPSLSGKAFKNAVNQNLGKIQALVKQQGQQAKAALTTLIEKSGDVIQEKVKEDLKK